MENICVNVLRLVFGPVTHDGSKHRCLTKRVISCFLRELCLFHEVEHRLCSWASSKRSSLWHGAGPVPCPEEDSDRGPALVVSEVDAFALNT